MTSYPWQQVAWDHLLKQWQNQHLAHALCYMKRMGQLAFAKEWAMLLLCESPGSQACYECASCQLMAAGNHPDYFQLGVLEKQQIKIEQVRDLINFTVQTHNVASGKWLLFIR